MESAIINPFEKGTAQTYDRTYRRKVFQKDDSPPHKKTVRKILNN
jgi:hypothetical protein